MTDADTPILHHYDRSPFAEKARLMLGLKGLAWKSVDIPVFMPKPDLMPLTGGYRKTPVMQIGANVYCDTQCIGDTLEAMRPSPSLYPKGQKGAAMGVLRWSESAYFMASVGSVIPAFVDDLPEAFMEDRAQFSGRSFDADGLKAAQPHALSQWRTYTRWVEEQLSDGRQFFFGDKSGAVDISLYMHIWFTRAIADEADISDLPHIVEWAERVGAIGHGEPSEMDAQAALDLARDTDPGAVDGAIEAPFSAGDAVTVTPEDSGRVPVSGKLLVADAGRITISRKEERVGEVAVHFPRAGFIIAPQK